MSRTRRLPGQPRGTMDARRGWGLVAACLLAASPLMAGCIAIDHGDTSAQLSNNSDESFTVPIVGSNRTASAPPQAGGALWDKHGPISETDCVGEGFSIVDSSGVVRATYDQPVCPDTYITIYEDGTITVISGGQTLTPTPEPSPSP